MKNTYWQVFFYSTSRLDFKRSREGNAFCFRNLVRDILNTTKHKFEDLQRFETRIMRKIQKFAFFCILFSKIQFKFIKSSIHNVDKKNCLHQKRTLIYWQQHPRNNFYYGLRYHSYIYQWKEDRKTPTTGVFPYESSLNNLLCS